MNSEKHPYVTCEDYTVSNQKFDLLYNAQYSMLETFPKPTGEELASYYESSDYISHTDSKETLTDKLYQTIKRVALKNKLNLLNSFQTEEKKVLDVGCGTGEFLLTCKNNGWNVVGVEPNKNARELAISKLNENNAPKIVSELQDISLQQFDVITLWHVLEHVPDLNSYIYKLKSLLKPNGVLVIAVPNYKSYDAVYYKQFWAAFDVPRHLWHFSKKSIQLIFSEFDMKVETTLPMKFDSFYVSLLSEKYKTGKSNFIKAFFIGFVSNLKALSSKEYSSLIYILKNI
ncbi:Methyltransferase domain-containing protein [Lutibacter agarilyticus]|uniref:Methyltransferase domain-containing protein n=1 Tax=Lutibacter agarilyticus TaxID=1109740 RepID=A0A238W2Z5_9FLAO|nr:class I SAM-dependent methyltransferase [Lutibacter agarilyticus]SNR40922.1 Methyltransferase domain-containing protein [Lutibacter agarilyticus]